MRIRIDAWRVLAAVSFLLLAVSTRAQVLVFDGVHVVPMDSERVLADQTVLVADGVVQAMGARGTISVPGEDALVIEGNGRYLMPGLAEMHGHLPNTGGSIPERWRDDLLFLYLANGVTLVRGMQGNAQHLELRDAIARGEVLGPRLYVASPQMSGQSVRSPGQGAELVEAHHAAGFDLLKIQEGLQAEVYAAIAERAKAVGIPFAGHVPNDVGLYPALDAGQQTVDHLDNAFEAIDGDPERIGEVVTALKRADVPVIPTMAFWETAFLLPQPSEEAVRTHPEVQYVPPPLRENWKQAVDARLRGGDPAEGQAHASFRRALLRALNEARAPILFGTDSPQIFSVPGFSIHREIAIMQECGMTPYRILESATRKVAEFLENEAQSGTVAPGKQADLVLLDGNPLEDLSVLHRPAGVAVQGRWLDREAIGDRLNDIAEAYAD